MRDSADLMIEPRWLLSMAPGGAVLEGHAVVVDAGRIIAVAPAAELRARFEPREHLLRESHALLPGLVNAHVRASLALLRAARACGEPGALPLECHSADFVRDGTRLAIAEMLRAGITCFADLSPHPEEAARVAAAAQVRAAIALPVGEGAAADGATALLARAERLWDEYRSDPRISLFFAPLAVQGLSDATLNRIRRVTDELDARLALELAPDAEAPESPGEVRDAPPRPDTEATSSPLARLAALGLLRPGTTVIGSAGAAEAQLLARHGAALVVCPQASLRCRPPAVPLLQGERTGLGTGSPAICGALDVLAEARTAALLSGFGAAAALRLATLGGATALGLQGQIGSIEPGKVADLTCIALEGLASRACARVEDAILFGATRDAVSDVWLGGRAAVRAHTLVAFDPEELAHLPLRWAQRLKMGVAA